MLAWRFGDADFLLLSYIPWRRKEAGWYIEYVLDSVLLQAWSGPEGSKKLRFPDYVTMAQDGGKVVSLTHWPPLPPQNIPGIDFC